MGCEAPLQKTFSRCGILIALLAVGSLAFGQENKRSRQLTQPSQAERLPQNRIALVIGNSQYSNAGKLNNPANDAHDLAAVLTSLSFEVVEKQDQTSDQMKVLIKQFGEKLKERKGVGLFYFAGHGIQVAGRNYLIPVDAKNLRENSIEFDAVDVGRVLTEMKDADNWLNVVILDACRSNPFTRSWNSPETGLAEIKAPTGTLIAYATNPGDVADDGDARNGLYTSELIRWLKEPGLKIEEMFKQVRKSVAARSDGRQVPAEYTMLTEDFVFTSPRETSPSSSNKVSGSQIDGRSDFADSNDIVIPGDVERWESIKNSKETSDYEKYLRDYPKGLFSGVARDRLTQLKFSSEGGGDGFRNLERVLYPRVRPIEKAGNVFVSCDLLRESVALPTYGQNEFLTSVIQSLKDADLVVTSAVADVAPQVYGAIAEIKKGRKASARSSPYVVAVDVSIDLEDIPTSKGMQTSVANISLRVIDLDMGEIATIENVEGKGFGVNHDQARRNALKEASRRVPADLIKRVAEISGRPTKKVTVLGESARVEEIPRRGSKVEVTVALPSLGIFPGNPAALYIGGRGWDGSSDIRVIVNGRDVSAYIDGQSRGSVDLKGSLENLNLLDGRNEVVVVAGGVKSSPYVFRKSINSDP